MPNNYQPGEIVYKNSPNVQVADENGTLHRAQLVAIAPGDIQYNDPDNSPNVQVMGEDGNYHRAQLVAVVGLGPGITPLPTTPNTEWVFKATVDGNGNCTIGWSQES